MTTVIMASDSSAVTPGSGIAGAEMLVLRERHSDSRIQDKERRDSGSCDHTELESNGIVYRDATTNTPSTAEVLG